MVAVLLVATLGLLAVAVTDLVMGDDTAGVAPTAQQAKNTVTFGHADNALTGFKDHSRKLQAGDV